MQMSEILIYKILESLHADDSEKANYYMGSLFEKIGVPPRAFFYLYHILGRVKYKSGDYLRAAKVFSLYEEARFQFWRDIDELSLFYRANCLALLGNFSVAATIYEKILNIKSDFPEAKKNLELVRKNTAENLVKEVSSLWNFCDWRDVPIFINARDRLGVMKKCIESLIDFGHKNLIVLDNQSTYPELLKYYSEIEKDSRIKIIFLEKNFGYKALWLSGILETLNISTPYVYTDPDVVPGENCPKDIVGILYEYLNANHEILKVGPELVWEDITFYDKETVQRDSGVYEKNKIDENISFVNCDTTFALYSNTRHYSLRFSLRTSGDMRFKHLPWYFDYENLPEDEKYYMEHADKTSVTTVKEKIS